MSGRFTLQQVFVALLVAVLSVGSFAAPAPAAARGAQRDSFAGRAEPAARAASRVPEAIPGEFIVSLRETGGRRSKSVREAGSELRRAVGVDVVDAIEGPRGRLLVRDTAGQRRLAERLAGIAGVTSVEPNLVMRAFDQTLPTGIDRVGADSVEQGVVPAEPNGAPPRPVAVVDTGIAAHPDLNIAGGYNCMSTDRRDWRDQSGHGTHVAGIIGAKQNAIGVVGVAPGAPLWAVRVLDKDGNGTTFTIACGFDRVAKWVENQPDPAKRIAVVNASLGGPSYESATNCASSSMHQAVCRLNELGVKVVAAAGNDADDVRYYTPAKFAQVTTVSALADTDGCRGGHGPGSSNAQVDDSLATYSNYGVGVDIAAPGNQIESTALNKGYMTLTGTSMAAPHVAGAFARGWNGVPNKGDPNVHDDTDPDARWDTEGLPYDPDGTFEGVLHLSRFVTRC